MTFPDKKLTKEEHEALELLPRCDNCNERNIVNEEYAAEHYNSPFATESKTHVYCSEECLEASENGDDFTYRYCDSCNRSIIIQCPSNGYRGYFVFDDGESICVKCWQDDAIENGIAKEKFEKRTIPGDFFNDDDLEKAGYKKLFDHVFVSTGESILAFNRKALDAIYCGYKVVSSIESSGMGLEGYVSLWGKIT
jgi:hypothetical protein